MMAEKILTTSAERRARSTLSTLKEKRSTSFAADKRPSLVRTSVRSTSTASTQQQPQAVQLLLPFMFTLRRPNMGSCFAFGKPGNWRSACPVVAEQQLSLA